jgi:hypothetical protein
MATMISPRRLRASVVVIAVAGSFALSGATGRAAAATYHAGNGASLSAAVAAANASSSPSTIELSAGTFLPTSTLTIGGDVTIVGPSSAPGARLQGGSVEPFPSAPLVVESRAKLTLWNLDLSVGGGAGAPAIDDFGALDLESSTLSGNKGPGVLVESRGSATVRNSTLSDGLDFGLVDDGIASLSSSTVALNKNGGVENKGTLSLTNTIVAGNGASDCVGGATASDHSLDGDRSCGVGALGGMNPELGPLIANGGPTHTRALETASPAIGAGDASKCPAEDQRHFARPAGRCDIGAYQTGATPSAGSGTGSGTGSGGPGGEGSSATGRLGRFVGLTAHGALQGARRSRIAFAVRAMVGHRRASFLYSDHRGHAVLRTLSVNSLVINATRGTATLRGAGVQLPGRRRVRVTLNFENRGGHRNLRIGLSSGYRRSGHLLSGSITFLRT